MALITISLGELYDKYSILQIKNEKIKDVKILSYIQKEMLLLKINIDKYNLNEDVYNELKQINEELWNIEDNIREKELRQDFDDEFIYLARMVYKTNDKRANVKKRINTILHSDIIEVKHYTQY
jgi:hypothetical protein